MEKQKLISHLRENYLFRGLSDELLEGLIPHFTQDVYQTGDWITREGDVSDVVFIILEGEVEVLKASAAIEHSQNPLDNRKAHLHCISTMGAGETFGEVGCLTGAPRSAGVRALVGTEIMSISYSKLKSYNSDYLEAANTLLFNLSHFLAKRLSVASTVTAEAMQGELDHALARTRLGNFVIYVVLLLSAYNLTLHYATSLSKTSPYAGNFVSVAMIFIWASALVLMCRRTGLPLRNLGVNLSHWRESLSECLGVTFVILVMFTVIKWLLINNVPVYADLPLFDVFIESIPMAMVDFGVYALFSPLQEFISRGILQSSLDHTLTGKHRVRNSILISNALFCAGHVHLSTELALVVFFPGLLWGWLFSRYRTLLGVSVSHILIGWYGLFILNFASLF